MSDFPTKELLQRLIPRLLEVRRHTVPPFVSADELMVKLGIGHEELRGLDFWFFKMGIWKPMGDRYEVTDFVEKFDRRYRVTTEYLDFRLLHQFANEQQMREHLRRATMVLAAQQRKKAALPSVSIATLLEFAGSTPDGRLVRAVAAPWFEILKLIKQDPQSIYQIDPFKFEEIIAGAWHATGVFDEVILTHRSGDLGRDVIATSRTLGSVRIVDQVKAYAPGRLVPANDVRALAGVLLRDQNVSKGIVTTTSDFAPKVRDEFSDLMPYRLELRGGDDTLNWLVQLGEGSE
ncbi:MAG: restriction endonuclease [Sedimenticolaceae bacterium]